MKHIKYIAYISLFLLASCSTTKNLPEGEVLYTGIKKIEVTNEDKSKEGEEALTEIEAALAYPPNNALLGSSSIRIPLPFGLWMYNAFVNRKGKVGKWIFNKHESRKGGTPYLHKAGVATHRTAPLEDRRHIGIPERLQQRATDRFHPV